MFTLAPSMYYCHSCALPFPLHSFGIEGLYSFGRGSFAQMYPLRIWVSVLFSDIWTLFPIFSGSYVFLSTTLSSDFLAFINFILFFYLFLRVFGPAPTLLFLSAFLSSPRILPGNWVFLAELQVDLLRPTVHILVFFCKFPFSYVHSVIF